MDLIESLRKAFHQLELKEAAIKNGICPFCGKILTVKDDWIFCPTQNNEIPTCDTQTHFALNAKTGGGWEPKC